MGLGRTRSVALVGFSGAMVDIEAHAADGQPLISIIGLPDAALSQSRDRVRSAATNAGSGLAEYRMVVNLSPATMPKHGSGFDLGIALACLAALGEVDPDSVSRVVHVGELGLDGRVRAVRGVLPAVLAAARAGHRTIMVPAANEVEARLVDGIDVVAVETLTHAAIRHGATWELPEPQMSEHPGQALDGAAGRADDADDARRGAAPPDLADVVGNEEAVCAMIAAAAGGHHVFLLGPPGAGKTMLAERLPGILPDLDRDAALEASCVASLSGSGSIGRLITRPPFENPHHTATASSIVGGGTGRIVPGAVSRATRGVLFLDEAPEFAASVLDSLRQPLESGRIRIDRSTAVAEFPARMQLVLAANPCPCGRFGIPGETCTCSPHVRRRYLARLSGPLLDRVDIRLTVRRIGAAQLAARSDTPGITTADARAAVCSARDRSAHRLRGTPWSTNAEVSGAHLRSADLRLGHQVTRELSQALERGRITMRGYDRILRLSWTLADLDGVSSPDATHINRALVLRGGDAS